MAPAAKPTRIPTVKQTVRRIYVGDLEKGVSVTLAPNERILQIDDEGTSAYIYVVGGE